MTCAKEGSFVSCSRRSVMWVPAVALVLGSLSVFGQRSEPSRARTISNDSATGAFGPGVSFPAPTDVWHFLPKAPRL